MILRLQLDRRWFLPRVVPTISRHANLLRGNAVALVTKPCHRRRGARLCVCDLPQSYPTPTRAEGLRLRRRLRTPPRPHSARTPLMFTRCRASHDAASGPGPTGSSRCRAHGCRLAWTAAPSSADTAALGPQTRCPVALGPGAAEEAARRPSPPSTPVRAIRALARACRGTSPMFPPALPLPALPPPALPPPGRPRSRRPHSCRPHPAATRLRTRPQRSRSPWR